MSGLFHVRTRLAAQELVVGDHRLARGKAGLDRHTRLLLLDGNARQSAGAAGLVPAQRHHREYDLAVKRDALLGEDRIVAEDRAAVVLSRNVGSGQNRDDTGCRPHRIEVERGDPAARGMWSVAGRHVHQRRRLGNVVDKSRRALDVAHGAVVGERPPNRAAAVSGRGPLSLKDLRRHAPPPPA